MPNLSTPISIPNATKWNITQLRAQEDALTAEITIALQTNGGIIISDASFVVRNGRSDRVDIVTPTAGGRFADALVVTSQALSTATGYTDLYNTYRNGGATPALRRAAVEAVLVSSGYLGSTLG